MISFDQAALSPLTSDALVEERVAQLVGRAVRRQLWLMFLDENDVQLPLLLPMDDMPDLPSDEPLPVGAFVDAAGASSIIVVLERYAGDELSAADRAWAVHVRESCAAASVPLRAILLSHRRGVRWIAADDYLC